MDPVYIGAIIAITLFIGCFVCVLGIYTYKECKASSINYSRI